VRNTVSASAEPKATADMPGVEVAEGHTILCQRMGIFLQV
jgi:hypothetical protein